MSLVRQRDAGGGGPSIAIRLIRIGEIKAAKLLRSSTRVVDLANISKEIRVTVTEDYLANNAEYASSFTGPLPMPPSKHVAIVACMDARLDVYRLLGLKEGEAHVIVMPVGGHRRRDPFTGDQSAVAGNSRDHPDSPHRLRDAHFHR